MSDQQLFVLVIAAIGFGLGWVALLLLMGGGAQFRLRERIRDVSVDPLMEREIALLGARYQRRMNFLESRMGRLPGMSRLQKLIDQSGLDLTPERMALICPGAALSAGIGVSYLGLGPIAPLAAALAFVLPLAHLRNLRAKRWERFEEQLPDALSITSRAMRAGLPFAEALKLVFEEMKQPASDEFGLVYTEIRYGGDPRAAMLGLLERIPSVSVMALVTSVLIQREMGGNLTELLDKLSGQVRQRFRFERTLRTLTAEARLTAWILGTLPFAMIGILSFMNPQLIPTLLADPSGRTMLMIALGMVVLGILWLRKIVDIKV